MLRLLASMTLLLGVAPALAQAQAPNQETVRDRANDRVICKSLAKTGSRLATKRVCMTAVQWEEHRRSEREAVESIQQKRVQPSG